MERGILDSQDNSLKLCAFQVISVGDAGIRGVAKIIMYGPEDCMGTVRMGVCPPEADTRIFAG